MGKKQARKFQFVKIKSSVGKITIMNAVCPFTNDEITLAKKCMLNKWDRPPDYDKRKQKYEMELKKTAAGGPGASLEHKDSFVSTEKGDKEEKVSEGSKREGEDANTQKGAPAPESKEDQEEKEPEVAAVEPKTRAPGGLWLEGGDLAHCFQYVLVYHNPRSYSSKVCFTDLWNNANESFVSNEEKMYIVLKQDEGAEEAARQNVVSEEFKDLPIDLDHEKSKVLFTFAPNGCLYAEKEPATNYVCSIVHVSLRGPYHAIECRSLGQAYQLPHVSTDQHP